VIDVRTLWPWDRDTVFNSVRRTGRLLVVHQAVRVGGFGAEIVAECVEHLFASLRQPPRRLGAPRVPVPYAEPLETLCRVSEAQIVAVALEMTR
jgi:pyruvate dehydrogenase E1 component beta subunit